MIRVVPIDPGVHVGDTRRVWAYDGEKDVTSEVTWHVEGDAAERVGPGLVRGLRYGEARITAKLGDFTAVATLWVNDPPIRKKLIEVLMPLAAINEASGREKSIRHGHPSTLHLWWARRPLAAARAVLFGQLVDDPSAWPELFLTEAAQAAERQRLHALIGELVKWENSNEELVINRARLEIARSAARSSTSPRAKLILGDPSAAEVNDYLATEVPPVHDPFAGGGTIPLEAQRLGLRAIASDLNPVAVLINKALIEIPPRFTGQAPVNPASRADSTGRSWKGARGLAEDVRYFAAWIREEAKKKIGHLYPDVELPKEYGGGKATVIAWLWARTVASPNPALKGAHVPLVSSFWLSTKEGRNTWVEPVVAKDRMSYQFEIGSGAKPRDPEAVEAGTKLGSSGFECLLTRAPIPFEYIRHEAQAGRMAARLMAIVVDGSQGRTYVPPTAEAERVARQATPDQVLDEDLPDKALGFRIQEYGLKKWRELFTRRQLVALTTFSGLVSAARARALSDAIAAGFPDDGVRLRDGGRGAAAYGDAVATYLSLCSSKIADAQSSLVKWMAPRDRVITTFSRNALPMVWDFAESNAFAEGSGDFELTARNMTRVLDELILPVVDGTAMQADAAGANAGLTTIVSTDPPYFDNIGYADLSDFFYVWLRRSLGDVFPSLMSTLLVPKAEELVASPHRHGSRGAAEEFFMDGMSRAFSVVSKASARALPVAIYYAFKQSESDDEGTASTGWETFLEALCAASLTIEGTWPMRTERGGRSRDIGSNALASSVVLVGHGRGSGGQTISRADFRRTLRTELPKAIRHLRHGSIAPVDVAQASIGPGMGIFTSARQVIDADGKPLGVREALRLVNEALDELQSEQEGEADADTRFAITWFETHGWAPGKYGEAETLAKARNVSVEGVQEAGVIESSGGKVRLLKRSELPDDWDPRTDNRLTVWEATHHLIKRLDEKGESAAAALLKVLDGASERARDLAYRLFTTCERKGWADDARAFNTLVVAWPDLEQLAANIDEPPPSTSSPQTELALSGPGVKKVPKKPRKARSK